MKRDMIEKQLELMDALMHSVSQKAQIPEAFKLFYGVFLKDMVHTTGGRTGQDWEPQVYFSYVLCRDDEVLAVAAPYTTLKEGWKRPLPSERLEALQAAGLPLFSDFYTMRRGEDGELTMSLKSRDCPSPSGWRLPTVRVPSELSDLLYKKGMARSPDLIPTDYGNQLGLCETHWYGGEFAGQPRPDAGLYCSAAGWVNRVRLGEHPWGGGPDWVPLPLDTRLERMRAGRWSGSPGHCMSAFLRLEAMPVAPLLSARLSKKYIEEHRSELQARYGSGVTYGQTARNVDRLLRSDSESERTEGESRLNDLTVLFFCDHKLRNSKTRLQKVKKSEVINEAKPAGRSLSDRLAGAGILENGSSYLPLVGDCLDDVFQGLSRLIGTGAPAQAFYSETPSWVWEDLYGEWDKSLDGLIYRVWGMGAPETVNSSVAEAQITGILRRLLIEPFCLLEEIRRLEEKHSALLEEIRERNKTLKKELKGMNFDGNVG
ncbi:MAG: hypothetical protein HDT33_07230 [Clostridiales bacterium]|nr:hypothetical protein [Clostridiales bacterium]